MTLQTDIPEAVSARAQYRPPQPEVATAARLPLVIGLGNVYLCDDGAGVHLVRRLKATLGDGTAFCMDGGLMSLSLYPQVERASALVLLHCADTGRAPGSVDVLEGRAMDDYLRDPRVRSIQERGLIDLLDLARQRACLPVRRALVCIQPKRLAWGEAMSFPVFQALPVAASRVGALLERWQAA